MELFPHIHSMWVVA